jgi:hypothetical protein
MDQNAGKVNRERHLQSTLTEDLSSPAQSEGSLPFRLQNQAAMRKPLRLRSRNVDEAVVSVLSRLPPFRKERGKGGAPTLLCDLDSFANGWGHPAIYLSQCFACSTSVTTCGV